MKLNDVEYVAGAISILKAIWHDGVQVSAPVALVLQGGGIRGLALIGQIKALERKLGDNFFALAGASAGAIVAAAIWSGHDATSLTEFLRLKIGRLGLARRMIDRRDLAQLLATPPLIALALAWNLAAWLAGEGFYHACALITNLVIGRECRSPERVAAFVDYHPGISGTRFEILLGEMLIAGMVNKGIPATLIDAVLRNSQPKFKAWGITFRNVAEIDLLIDRFISLTNTDNADFDQLVTLVNQKGFAELAKQKFKVQRTNGIPRNNLLELAYGPNKCHNTYFAPIMFSICDLVSGQPIIAGNLDDRYDDIPIATLVRASAGFPFAFRPRRLTIDGQERLLVDGGLALNFPAEALVEDMQRLLRGGGKLPRQFIFLQSQPCIAVGLSTFDRPTDMSYLASTLRLALGGAKARLEHSIAKKYPYFRMFAQEMRGHPAILRFDKVTKAYLDRLVEESKDFVEGNGSLSNVVDLESEERAAIELAIASAMQSVTQALGGLQFCRAHFFLPGRERVGELRKKALFCIDCTPEEQPDRKDVFSQGGLISQVVRLRQPLYCRIDELQRKRQKAPNRRFLGLRHEDVVDVRSDLNMCFAFPIYDPRFLSYSPKRAEAQPLKGYEDTIRVFDDGLEGAVLGVLSIDGFGEQAAEDWPWLEQRIISSGVVESVERRMLEVGWNCSKALRRGVIGRFE